MARDDECATAARAPHPGRGNDIGATPAGTDTLFVLLGAIMVVAMQPGFPFLELGTVRYKNQVNARVKILVDFAVSTIACFFIGDTVAYGTALRVGAETLTQKERLRADQVLLPADLRGGDSCNRLRRNRRAGSVVVHAVGGWVGLVAGVLFVRLFTLCQNRWKIDDVLGVWPLHGLCGAWGGIGCGIFGQRALGGLGGVSLGAQVAGTALGIVVALTGAAIVYGVLRRVVALRLSDEQEFDGADIAIHWISATPERELQS